MINPYKEIREVLLMKPNTWLITGVAGFIGSNLLEALLNLNQHVVGLDNFSTGTIENLDDVRNSLYEVKWQNFKFIEGDIRNLEDCRTACDGVDYVLHQAAIGSVTRSIEDPIYTNENNITGFLNMLIAARDAKVKRFVYASSSSVYGNHPALPKMEGMTGKPLSPYAVTKYVNELYADVFMRIYGLKMIGLRYFNVFGPRQDPNSSYAAVIPKWFSALLHGEPLYINGDGETTRDFCFIDNVIQANILSACVRNENALGHIYNIAFSEQNTLNQLFYLIRDEVVKHKAGVAGPEPIYREFRAGDIRYSLADISKAKELLGYYPKYSLRDGIGKAAEWYIVKLSKKHLSQ